MQFSKEILKGAAETIVLSALQETGEAYGYQLITHISASSNTIFEFKEGTLYPLLYRLEKKGFVTSHVKAAPSGKERRYYRLTKDGAAHLKKQSVELRSFIDGLRHVLPSTPNV